MPKVTKEDQANLQATIHVDIPREEYQPEFEKKLKEFRGKVAMKGFRKGKAPLSVLKKMYGRSVLVEVVNDLLSKELEEYMKNAETEFLGQPIPSAAQETPDFDPIELKDFRFSFDIGMAPEFEVQGLTKEKTFEYYMPEITDEMVRQELEQLRQAHATTEEVEGDYQEGDLLFFHATEKTDKEEPHHPHFLIRWEDIAPAYQEKLAALKPGDTLEVDNIYEFAKDWSEEDVDSRILGWKAPEEEGEEAPEKPGPAYVLELEKVQRRVPAALDQEFFDKVFGEDKVHSEEEALEQLRGDMRAYYEGRSDTRLYREIYDYLMELHNEETLPLPDDFLKRWLKESSEKNTDEIIEEGYADFARNLRWSLIKSKLAKKYDIEVGADDIINHMRMRVRQMLSGYGLNDPRFIDQMLQRLLQDQKEVERTADEVMEIKLLEPLKQEFTLVEKTVPLEEFEQLIAPPQEEETPEEAGAKEAARVAADIEGEEE